MSQASHPAITSLPFGVKLGYGPVSFYIFGPSAKVRAKEFTSSKVIQKLEAGLPFSELEDLRASLELPMENLLPMLGISKATLHRRKADGRLDKTESDRVIRYARLLGKAVEVLEGIENARLWLNAPQTGLGGATPLKYAETEVGAREVEDLLNRIEFGVYS